MYTRLQVFDRLAYHSTKRTYDIAAEKLLYTHILLHACMHTSTQTHILA